METAGHWLVESVRLQKYGHTDLVGDVAVLLDAGSHGADQTGLLAVAGKVGQRRAAIGGQGRDEAVELQMSVDARYQWLTGRSYRADGNIRELSVGQTGSNESNERGRELHIACRECLTK